MTLVAPVTTPGAELDQAISVPRSTKIGPPTQRAPDPVATEIRARWENGREQMQLSRQWYWMNLAFYLGYQWVWWSRARGAVLPYPEQRPSPLARGRVRLTLNRYGPNVLNVWNRLCRSELAFEVPPSDSADNIVEAAKRSEKVADALRREQGWDGVKADAVLAALLGGTSAVSVEWDGRAGKQLEWDEARGIAVGTGDAVLRSHNVNEFVIEPNVREYRRARWWISGVALPVGAVQEMFDLPWLPRPDAEARSGPMYEALVEGSGRQMGRNLCLVLTYYERPAGRSKGMYACVVNDVVVHRSEWPFDFDEINLTVFRQKQIDAKVLGATYLTDALAIQVAYNHARSVLQEHMKLAGNARLMAPFGSLLEEDLHSAAGDILYWSPDGSGSAPMYLAPPNLPRWLTAEAQELRDELDNVMHVSDVSRGKAFDRASGQALTFLAEQDDSSLGGMVWEQKHGWERIATQVLTTYGERVKETRHAITPLAPGVTDRMGWNGAMLQGQYRVVVPLEAVTPKNAAARMANAKDLWDRKIITDPRRYARMTGLPPEEFAQLLSPDSAKANTENLRMLMGIPEHPDDFDDHAIHIAEHNDRCRKTDSYKYASPEFRAIVDDHVKWHENKAANEFARQKALADQNPALPGVPQASAPDGSGVPMSEQEQQARMALEQGQGGGGGGGPAQLPAAGLPSAAGVGGP